MIEQLDLKFAPVPEPHPRLAELMAILDGKGWLTAAQLGEMGFNDRELRVIVQSDREGAILSFPGGRGYRLFDQTPIEEIRRADALKNQAEAMLDRWATYQKRLHRRGGPTR